MVTKTKNENVRSFSKKAVDSTTPLKLPKKKKNSTSRSIAIKNVAIQVRKKQSFSKIRL